MTKNIFVFVVCGAQEHIDTLHYSLKYLQKFSKNEIWILTDSTRNEIPIQHDKIVDVETPNHFNHHQASIFLKTGIHNYFPKGNKYCYLDTDILALSEEVDNIFDQYIAPITFAPDHCKMNQFSPYAVNCECTKEYQKYADLIEQHLVAIDPLRNSTKTSIVENRKKMIQFYQENNSLVKKISVGIRFVLTQKRFKLTDGIYFDKKNKVWHDDANETFMNHFKWPQIAKKCGLKWNYLKSYPMLPDGRSLWQKECNHLQQFIKQKFNVDVTQSDFQHWNGGVFLFDDQSHDFLNHWHNSTMEIFKDSQWKTRDQGTLIKTIWYFGLSDHPTLNKKWNAIADYYSPYLKWVDNQTVQLNDKDIVKPALLHVYHHFGDTNWEFWNKIIKIDS